MRPPIVLAQCLAHLGMRWVDNGTIRGHVSIVCRLEPGHAGDHSPDRPEVAS